MKKILLPFALILLAGPLHANKQARPSPIVRLPPSLVKHWGVTTTKFFASPRPRDAMLRDMVALMADLPTDAIREQLAPIERRMREASQAVLGSTPLTLAQETARAKKIDMLTLPVFRHMFSDEEHQALTSAKAAYLKKRGEGIAAALGLPPEPPAVEDAKAADPAQAARTASRGEFRKRHPFWAKVPEHTIRYSPKILLNRRAAALIKDSGDWKPRAERNKREIVSGIIVKVVDRWVSTNDEGAGSQEVRLVFRTADGKLITLFPEEIVELRIEAAP